MDKERRNRRIKVIVSVISAVGFLLCALVLMYPVISDRWNRYRDSLLITVYVEQTKTDDTYANKEE